MLNINRSVVTTFSSVANSAVFVTAAFVVVLVGTSVSVVVTSLFLSPLCLLADVILLLLFVTGCCSGVSVGFGFVAFFVTVVAEAAAGMTDLSASEDIFSSARIFLELLVVTHL